MSPVKISPLHNANMSSSSVIWVFFFMYLCVIQWQDHGGTYHFMNHIEGYLDIHPINAVIMFYLRFDLLRL